MTDITKIMNNFHDFLRNAEPNLRLAGVVFGEDSWDDFSELNFRLLVTDTVAEMNTFDISNVYGQWTTPKEDEVITKVDSGAKALIGEVRKGDSISVSYKEVVLNEDLEFYFREFKYPFADDEKNLLLHLEHVAGEYSKNGKRFHVSVPMKFCKFLIQNP